MQGLDISVTVCLLFFLCAFVVCMVTDFSSKDKASGIQGRESPIFVNFAPPEAQNQTNRRARQPCPLACKH